MKPSLLPRALQFLRVRPPHVAVCPSQAVRLFCVIVILLSAASLAPSPPAGAKAEDSPQIVISQVYGGGGASGALYQSDFIELHNAGQNEVDISGWSIQYVKLDGAASVVNLEGRIPAGKYFLISGNSAKACTLQPCGQPLPPADATSPVDVLPANGMAYLVSNRDPVDENCGSVSGVVDMIGYGSVDCYEGEEPAPGSSNSTAVIRLSDGCLDRDDNGDDFVSGTPVPRNSSAPAIVCNPTTVALVETEATRRTGLGLWPVIVALLGLTVTGRFLLARAARGR